MITSAIVKPIEATVTLGIQIRKNLPIIFSDGQCIGPSDIHDLCPWGPAPFCALSSQLSVRETCRKARQTRRVELTDLETGLTQSLG
jgi:hypothetical protein